MELIQQFDLLASSLGGVAKLRELILSLAVRGKLVPQDPADEPASVLLKTIRAEKERLIAEGKIKKDKPLAPISSDEKPFELPERWEWVRLADIAAVLNGKAYKQHELLEAGTPVLRVGNLFTSSHWYYSDLKLEEDKYCDMGDLLFAWSASFGPFIWPGPKAIYHYHIWKLNLHSATHFNKQYLYTFLQEKTQELKAGGHGVSMVHMTKDSMEKTLLPVPPLPEQSRIVAKVGELMALCDRLEAEQSQAVRVQGHWVEAALAQLADSADADEFARHWQHLAQHFDTLFTTPDSITQLEATLLQLAVRGKLVPQDPNDEPASTLLQKIRTEKDRLIAEGKIKKNKPLPAISDEEKPFALPDGWEWVQWGDLTKWVTYGFTRPMPHLDHGMPIVTAKNVQYGWMDLENVHFTSAEAYFSLSPKDKPRRGDILITKDGSIGRAAHVQTDTEFCINQSVAVLWMAGLPLNRDYLILVAHAPFMQERIWAAAEGAAIKHISITEFVRFALPLPPLAEQSRIVAKLESLFTLTAGLKAQLAKAQQTQILLADALIDEAVA